MQVKERPILFSGSMVRAIFEDRKTVTRRVPSTEVAVSHDERHPYAIRDKKALWHTCKTLDEFVARRSPYGKPGDILWVRETWRPRSWGADFDWMCIEYRADEGTERERFKLDVKPVDMWPEYRIEGVWQGLSDECRDAGCPLEGEDGRPPIKWRPSIFMPRAACRLKLRITDVRVERLHEITAAQCIAEGIQIERDIDTPCGEIEAFEKMQALWNGINAKRDYGWDVNPYVWVVEFERVDAEQQNPGDRVQTHPSLAARMTADPSVRG